MKKISPITPWLERKAPLSGFLKADKKRPNREWGGFLSIDIAQPIYESHKLSPESLDASWKAIHNYVKSALRLIDSRTGVSLDSYEADLIRENLGEPPPICYPIYLITVAMDGHERVVYIGKSSAEQARFSGGHAAITKLHDPKFDGHTKTIYLAGVVLLSDDLEYQPLEWVEPLDEAHSILASIEAQLIYWFKPELNTHHIHRNNSKWPVRLMIQNFSGHSEFLHDHLCSPSGS